MLEGSQGSREILGVKMDVMGVPGGQGSARVVPEGQGECPRGSTRTLGVSGGQGRRQGGQGGRQGIPGGQEGCPRGRGKSRGSKGVKRDVWGAPGAQGSARDI